MRILGIDPGLRLTGFGVIEANGGFGFRKSNPPLAKTARFPP